MADLRCRLGSSQSRQKQQSSLRCLPQAGVPDDRLVIRKQVQTTGLPDAYRKQVQTTGLLLPTASR